MKKVPPASPDRTSKFSKDYLEIRVPKLSFKDSAANGYLVFTLVIFSFLLGMLTNKVIYLETLGKSATNNAQVADNIPPSQPTPPTFAKVSNGTLPILGNENAKVTIVEFSDFQCPFCLRYFNDTAQKIYDAYIKTGKAKLYYRHYPLTEIHPNAQKAGESSECADDQGAFWTYHDLLFKNQVTWSPLSQTAAIDNFVDLAGQLGLDTDQFRTCLETDKYKKAVADDEAAGQQAQVDGTPTFFINGQRLVGAQPFSAFQDLIDKELKK